jgi:hypothetical protein
MCPPTVTAWTAGLWPVHAVAAGDRADAPAGWAAVAAAGPAAARVVAAADRAEDPVAAVADPAVSPAVAVADPAGARGMAAEGCCGSMAPADGRAGGTAESLIRMAEQAAGAAGVGAQVACRARPARADEPLPTGRRPRALADSSSARLCLISCTKSKASSRPRSAAGSLAATACAKCAQSRDSSGRAGSRHCASKSGPPHRRS